MGLRVQSCLFAFCIVKVPCEFPGKGFWWEGIDSIAVIGDEKAARDESGVPAVLAAGVQSALEIAVANSNARPGFPAPWADVDEAWWPGKAAHP